jgi:hypothetical protein
MISLAKFKELTESEGLYLSDLEALEARETIYQLLELAFNTWIEQQRESNIST